MSSEQPKLPCSRQATFVLRAALHAQLSSTSVFNFCRKLPTSGWCYPVNPHHRCVVSFPSFSASLAQPAFIHLSKPVFPFCQDTSCTGQCWFCPRHPADCFLHGAIQKPEKAVLWAEHVLGVCGEPGRGVQPPVSLLTWWFCQAAPAPTHLSAVAFSNEFQLQCGKVIFLRYCQYWRARLKYFWVFT